MPKNYEIVSKFVKVFCSGMVYISSVRFARQDVYRIKVMWQAYFCFYAP